MKFKNNFLIIAICVLGLASSSNAQTRISSPYSRYGLGDLQNNKYIRNISMGGIAFGFRNAGTINYLNPASYTAFDSTSFVLETGVNSQFVKLSTNDLQQSSNYTTLSNLVFGFPVTKWWGASIGLVPYSNVGYKISDLETKENIGNIKYMYEGSGGLSQFYLGNGFKIKNLSAGFNASYVFGTLQKSSAVTFPDSINLVSTRLKNTTQISNFMFTYGVQYHKTIANNLKLCVGLTYNASANLKAKQDSLVYNYTLDQSQLEYVRDTLINVAGTKGDIVIPQSIGGGFTLGKTDRWLIGMDYQTQNWKNFSAFNEKDSLKNSWMASVGAEFTPKNSAVSGYWKRVHYRVGGRYNQTYLQLRNTQLNEVAVSVGFGFPLKRSKTTLNVGFELGQRGTTDNSLIKEQFGRVTLNLSIYEFWFMKRKFD